MRKNKFPELVEDYSRHPVPVDKSVSGLRIAIILIGVTITVPAFLIGFHVGQQQGVVGTALASVFGGLILFGIAMCTGIIAVRTRLSTYMIMPIAFGHYGAHIVNALIGFTLLGWFGVIGSLFATSLQSSLADVVGLSLPWLSYLLFGSFLMVLTTIFGFKALDRLAQILVPLMAIFMLYILYLVLDSNGMQTLLAAGDQDSQLGAGTSIIVGGYIIGMTLYPDICRYAESEKGATIGAFLGCVIGYPAVLMIAGLASIAGQESDFIALVMTLGLGIGGISFLVFSTWTTNANTLYSTSLALATMLTRLPKWQLAVFAGVIGTLLAALGIVNHFERFLGLLSSLIPPVAGIYITDYFLVNRQNYHQYNDHSVGAINVRAFIAWIIASCVALLTVMGVFELTTISSLDSILIACVTYLLLQLIPDNGSEQ